MSAGVHAGVYAGAGPAFAADADVDSCVETAVGVFGVRHSSHKAIKDKTIPPCSGGGI